MVGTRAGRDGRTVLEEREALSEERTLQQKRPVKPVCDPALRKFRGRAPGGGNSKLEVQGKDSDWWSRRQSGSSGGHTGVLSCRGSRVHLTDQLCSGSCAPMSAPLRAT